MAWGSILKKLRIYVGGKHYLVLAEIFYPATALVRIEDCPWGQHIENLPMRCILFSFFRDYMRWWLDYVANTIESCLWYRSVEIFNFFKHLLLWHLFHWFPDSSSVAHHLFVDVVLGAWITWESSRSFLVTSPHLATKIGEFVSHIASMLGPRSSFTSFMCTTRSLPCVMFVASAVVYVASNCAM